MTDRGDEGKLASYIPMPMLSIDIEVTNRCNAKCHFCPRDRTPHQGLMEPETFDHALRRSIEYRQICHDLLDIDVEISLCGLGEPMLNKHVYEYARKARDAGFVVNVSSNGSLLTEEKGRQLLDAGINRIIINAGETGDDYEEIYGLPFEKTLENIVGFNEMAGDDCLVGIVVVDHRMDEQHFQRMTKFWNDHGIQAVAKSEIMNRGGSLFVDHMQYEQMPELVEARQMFADRSVTPTCPAPVVFLFIGYDGQYYLCCSDWEKQTPMGHVSDVSFVDVTRAKLEYVTCREPVCRTCNLDPINMVTDALRAERQGVASAGTADRVFEQMVTFSKASSLVASKFGLEMPDPAQRRVPSRRIPVASL